jgi:hypothetical protein
MLQSLLIINFKYWYLEVHSFYNQGIDGRRHPMMGEWMSYWGDSILQIMLFARKIHLSNVFLAG